MNNEKESRIMFKIKTIMKPVIEDDCDITGELQNEIHRSLNEVIRSNFQDPDIIENLITEIEMNLDTSIWENYDNFPDIQMSLLETEGVDAEIKKARQEERKMILKKINKIIEDSFEFIDNHKGFSNANEITRQYGKIDGFGELRKDLKQNE